MAKTKTRKKTIRREAFEGVEPLDALDEERPNLGRLIENGLLMLMPLIVERIVASATAPERHPPVSVNDDANRAYGIGLKDATERIMQFVPVPVPGCACSACKSLEIYADKFGRARVQ